MWKRILISFILVIALIMVGMYGASMSIQRLQERFGGKSKPQEPTPFSNIYQTIQSWMPTVTVWSIVAIVLTVASIIIYKAYVARGRLLETIKPRDFPRHILLFGPTGSGKTSTAVKATELAIRKSSDIIIIDWKGEYGGYFNGATVTRKLDILKPDVDYETYSLILTDILRDVLELTEPMSYMLYDELVRGYRVHGDALTFSKLIKSLEARRLSALNARSYAEANIAEGLIRRVYLLALDEKRDATNTIGSDMVNIYDLSVLPTYQLRCLYAQIILWRIYNNVKSSSRPVKKPRLSRLLVLEESQNYIRPRRPERAPSIGERIVNELRGYGVGALIISPDPTQLPYHMARDSGAVVSIGYQGLPEVVAELLSFYRYADIKKLIKTTGKMRTYIYYNGKLYIKDVPKPYRKTIDLGVTVREEKVETVLEEAGAGEARPVVEAKKPIVKVVEPELKLEEEEAAVGERPTEAEKPVVTEEAEGPRSSRVDPLGGIPLKAVERLHATAGAGQTRGIIGA